MINLGREKNIMLNNHDFNKKSINCLLMLYYSFGFTYVIESGKITQKLEDEMMNKAIEDNNIRQIKAIQEELDHRQKVEREAEALMCQGKVQESLQLINSLDDSVSASLLT